MATNIGTDPRGGALAHFTLVSLDLSRLRAIRARRSLVYVALASCLVLAGFVAGGSIAFMGAPLWLAMLFGAATACTVLYRVTASHERVGPSFYSEA